MAIMCICRLRNVGEDVGCRVLCEPLMFSGEPDKDNKVIRCWCHGNKTFICNTNIGNRQISANGAARGERPLGNRLKAQRLFSLGDSIALDSREE